MKLQVRTRRGGELPCQLSVKCEVTPDLTFPALYSRCSLLLVPKILAFGIVLCVDWFKPCDTPLKTIIACIFVLDISKLALNQDKCYVDGVLVRGGSIEGKKMQMTIELCHMFVFIWGVKCLFQVTTQTLTQSINLSL